MEESVVYFRSQLPGSKWNVSC